ncbi:hypothetical protein QJS66_08665 [Kocuria rhizophila]|nr:hypothetical protein QJS66_08665 [Kocuria rhizophila]
MALGGSPGRRSGVPGGGRRAGPRRVDRTRRRRARGVHGRKATAAASPWWGMPFVRRDQQAQDPPSSAGLAVH